MNRIVFTELAEDDLIDIWVTVATDNEVAADRLVDEIHAVTRKLLTFPHMGRTADELRPGARAFVHAGYLFVYRPMAYGIQYFASCTARAICRGWNTGSSRRLGR